jgi:4-hydroxybenzoate polyprenyltransferase
MFDHICTWIDNPKLILVKMFLISLRPKQWTKNLLLYMAFFFTVNEAWQLGEPGELISMGFAATSAMVIFAILSGTIYVFNDVLDKDEDSLHPQKSNRPIASGNLPIPIARNGALILVVIGVGSAFL